MLSFLWQCHSIANMQQSIMELSLKNYLPQRFRCGSYSDVNDVKPKWISHVNFKAESYTIAAEDGDEYGRLHLGTLIGSGLCRPVHNCPREEQATFRTDELMSEMVLLDKSRMDVISLLKEQANYILLGMFKVCNTNSNYQAQCHLGWDSLLYPTGNSLEYHCAW